MKKSPRRLALVLSLAVGLLAGLLAAGFAAFALALRPPAGLAEEGLLFTVRAGEGAGILAARLEAEGAIRSALAFRLLAKARGDEGRLKAGVYRIEPAMGGREVLDAIVSGRQALVRLTVPEGATLSRVALILEEGGVAAAAEFRAAARDPALLSELGIPGPSLEGYLFPDTYFMPLGYGAAGAARAMAAAFRSRLASIPEAAALSPEELREKIILASIVEREYRVADEAPVMASVFYNRLRIGMALQSCATVVYVITEKLGKPHPERLFDRDIAIPDAYNTYLARGLPPGPIANPGMTAIRSVFYPARTNYLYFRLVDESAGRHHFSETLEEHNDARSLFVKRAGGK